MAYVQPNPSGFQGIGPLGGETAPGIYKVFTEATAADRFEIALSLSIGVMTVIAGIWFMYQIFSGAIEWLSSGGEKQAVQNAQKRITNAVTGIVIVVLSYAIILSIGYMVGFKDILWPATVIMTYLKP
jgi:succinate dehydrogenase hydrophobic anchor subunit